MGPPPGLSCIQDRKRSKKYSKWCPKWRPFRHFELPSGHLGPLLEGPGVKIWCPRSILCTLLKHQFLLVFLLVFGGLGSPVELQMVASALLWGPYGGLSVIFGCKKCCIEFWSPKMIPVPWLRWVKVGRGKRSAAEAGLSGGGGGFASEPCKVLCPLFSTPCYL